MNATLLILLLALMPPGLMGVAHVYAVRSQDRRVACLIVLDGRVKNADRVVADHEHRYHVHVVQRLYFSVKAYRASVPLKHLNALERDPRVADVQRVEIDDEHRNPTRF